MPIKQMFPPLKKKLDDALRDTGETGEIGETGTGIRGPRKPKKNNEVKPATRLLTSACQLFQDLRIDLTFQKI